MEPVTVHAKGRDGWVAYQVVGDGPVEVIVYKPWFFPVDLMWEEPSFVRMLEGFASFSRSIWLDARGTGASDGIEHIDGRLVESMVDDMLVVLDDVGWEQASVFGWTSPPSVLLAATHPERVKALVLSNPSARFRRADGYPEGSDDTRTVEVVDDQLRARWGDGSIAGSFVKSRLADERFARWCARCERLAMEPAESFWRTWIALEVDQRELLSSIRVPTLVILGGEPDRRARARYVADHISGAEIVEVDATDLLILGSESGPVLDATERFLTGGLPSHGVDRMFATVMFTDVVRSTETLARTGDRRWRELLASHDTLIRAELTRFEGREVKSTGDGVLATFDGPGRAVRCASAIRDRLRSLGITVRIGLHAGEVERRGDDITGIAVNIAQRVQGLAQPDEVLVSRTVVDLVAGSGLLFTDRGNHPLKGVPDEWTLFATVS